MAGEPYRKVRVLGTLPVPMDQKEAATIQLRKEYSQQARRMHLFQKYV